MIPSLQPFGLRLGPAVDGDLRGTAEPLHEGSDLGQTHLSDSTGLRRWPG